MGLGLLRRLESSGGFDDDINLKVFPRQLLGIRNRKHGVRFSVDNERAIEHIYPGFVATVYRVVPEQVCHVGYVADVINGDNLQLWIFRGDLEGLAANAAKPIDCNTCGHDELLM